MNAVKKVKQKFVNSKSVTQAGNFQLESNERPEVTPNKYGSFRWVDFETPFPVGSEIHILVTCITFNGADTLGLRIGGVTNEGFYIRFNEVVINSQGDESDGRHIEETVSYTATSVA